MFKKLDVLEGEMTLVLAFRRGKVTVKKFCDFIVKNRAKFIYSSKEGSESILETWKTRYITVKLERPYIYGLKLGNVYLYIDGKRFDMIDDKRIIESIKEGQDPGPGPCMATMPTDSPAYKEMITDLAKTVYKQRVDEGHEGDELADWLEAEKKFDENNIIERKWLCQKQSCIGPGCLFPEVSMDFFLQ
jgi:hypothetical protein